MSSALKEVANEAMKLSRQERLALVGLLLDIEEGANGSAELEAAWEKELLSRIKAIDDGTAVGVPYDEVMCVAEDRLGR